MFETTSGKTKEFFGNIASNETFSSDRIPTLDKTLDSYFDRNSEAIIEEWGLLTDADIGEYQRKLDYLSYEVGRLVTEKDLLKNRAESIEKAIAELEGKK